MFINPFSGLWWIVGIPIVIGMFTVARFIYKFFAQHPQLESWAKAAHGSGLTVALLVVVFSTLIIIMFPLVPGIIAYPVLGFYIVLGVFQLGHMTGVNRLAKRYLGDQQDTTKPNRRDDPNTKK